MWVLEADLSEARPLKKINRMTAFTCPLELG